jgi:hypothetical protein
MSIERGAVVMGTDGPLGTIEQIVMDENTGELRALILRGGHSGADTEDVEIAAAHVVPGTAVGQQVNLDIGMADIRAHPELAHPYDPHQYVPIHEEVVLPSSEADRAAVFSERPVVTEIRDNAAEVVVPGPGSASLETEETIAGEHPDASPMQTALTADEQPTLVLRAPRSLSEREQALDTPAPRVDVEPAITPDEVAATAAEVPYQSDASTVSTVSTTDRVPDESPADITNANPAPDLGASNTVPEASSVNEVDEDEWTAEASTPDGDEERHEDLPQMSQPQYGEPPEADDPGEEDVELTSAEVDAVMSDVDGSNVRTLRSMGDSVWVAVPSVAGLEDWQQSDSNWRSYNYDLARRGNLGILMAAGLGLIAAVGTVLLMRQARKRKASRLQQMRARDIAGRARRQASAARAAVPAALESAAGTARNVRRAANDLPGRWRWFRRGVRVGATVAAPLARVQASRRRQLQQAQDTAAQQPVVVAQ